MKKVTSLLFLMLFLWGSISWGQNVFFEGFETGNTQETTPVGWTQVSVSGSDSWLANTSLTTYNRTPRTDSWNAFLRYGNTDWMFKEVTLSAGTTYELTFYARQDVASGANILASYGTEATVLGMVNPIIELSAVTNGDYQLFSGSFSPATSETFFIGIRADLNYSPWYISIDDISLDEFAAGTPLPPTDPVPANASADIPVDGTCTWTFGANTATYDLMFGPAGNMMEVVSGEDAGATGSYAYAGLNNSTAYQWQVIEYNGALNTNGPVWGFTTVCGTISSLPWNQGFESVTIPALPLCWFKENGDYVTTNNANSTYDADAHTGTQFLRESYSATNEYIWTPGFALTAGTSYDFSFWWAGDTYAGWTGDVFYNTTQISTAATQMGASFVVPATTTTKTYQLVTNTLVPVTTGTYYFAIRINATSSPWYLSFDDFKLDISPDCPAPTLLMANNITPNSADLSWTAGGGETLWDLVYGEPGFDPDQAIPITGIDAIPYTLEGLTPATSYEFYVRADCGETDETSSWSLVKGFTTSCIEITEFTEGFDDVTIPALPVCWSKVGASGSASTQTTNPFSAPNCLYMYSYTTEAVVSMPPLSNAGAGTHLLSFKARANFTVGGVLHVGYLTDPTDAASFVSVTSVTVSSLVYEDYVANLGTAPAGYNTLAFRASSTPPNSMLIDDVSWSEFIPGTIEGTVSTSDSIPIPIENARVFSGTYEGFTDPTGFYSIPDLPPGTYSFSCAAAGFVTTTVDSVEIIADGTTTLDFDMSPTVYVFLRGNVTDAVTASRIGAVEVTAGMFTATTSMPTPYSQGGFYNMSIPTGTYDISFSHPDYYTYTEVGVEVVAGDPYQVDAVLDPIPPGGDCSKAIEQALNGVPVMDTLLPGEHWWYTFTLAEDYVGLNISACGSTFDTKLAVFEDCDDFVEWPTYGPPVGAFAYNDDNFASCGSGNNSHIDDGTTQTAGITLPDTVPAGTYYVALYGYSATSNGVYMFEVYGIPLSEVGWLDGMVSDPLTKAAVEGVTITAAPFSTQTGEDGMYAMEVQAGTYDLTAEKPGYIPATEMGVVVATANTTTVDFDLEFAAPELLTADPTFFDVTLTWERNPLFLANKDSKETSGGTMATNHEIGSDRVNLNKKPSNYRFVPAGKAIGDSCANPALAVEGPNSCPGAPYWYEFTPDEDSEITISSCIANQEVDTKLYVYDACDGTEVAYNDDLYSACAYYDYASAVTFPAHAGTSYKIYWDPYWETVPFEFNLETNPLCDLECPVGATVSTEPCPGDEYVDTYNGGCLSEPPVFETIACGQTICATASTYIFTDTIGTLNNYRDTDWYELVIMEPTTISFSGIAEFPLYLALMEQTEPGVPGCDNITGYAETSVNGSPCMEVTLDYNLYEPGTYYLLVAPSVFVGYACGGFELNDYYVTLSCAELIIPYVEVYRDDQLIASVLEENTYVDTLVEQGIEYCYHLVQLVSPEIALPPSNVICPTIPFQPEITVNPLALSVMLDLNQTSLQLLTVTNSGPGALDWTATIDFGTDNSRAVLIEDNIDAYTAGMPLAQEAALLGNNYWTTWSELPGSAEDPLVTTDQAASAPNSFVIEAGNDCVLLLGDLTEGMYNVDFDIFIPTGSIGYFNLLQAFAGADSEWGMQAYFDVDGAGLVDAGAAGAGVFTYNYDTWITVHLIVDLDTDYAKMYVDGALVVEWVWSTGSFGDGTLNQLGAANFFAWDETGTPKYYIDNVILSEYELPEWLTIDPTSGTIGPDKGFNEINVNFSSIDYDYGFYTADILINSNDPVNPQIVVPVEMLLGGILEGTVTDPLTKRAIEGVTITAEEVRATTVTGPDGKYTMSLAPGNYKVWAAKPGYVTDTLLVMVPPGETTTLDFELAFAATVLVSVEADFFDVSLVWENNPAFVTGKDNFAYDASLSNHSGIIEKEATQGVSLSNHFQIIEKEAPQGVYVNPGGTRQGGDDIATATIIPAIPYSDVGTTVGYNNDYDEVCPYTGSTAPDVVYSYAPTADIVINVDLCASSYDTKVYIYENDINTVVACNDDACGLQSMLTMVSLTVGNTYYIVVDGYGTDAGDYDMMIDEFVPGMVVCPAEGIPEPEACGEDLNGGCNNDGDPTYTSIACGEVYCGTAWADAGRDTDWYELVLGEVTELTWHITAEFDAQGIIIDGTYGCDDYTVLSIGTAVPYDTVVVTATVAPGTYWLWVGPSVLEGYPCGENNDYVAWVTCTPGGFLPYVEVYRNMVEEPIATVYTRNTYVDMDVVPGEQYCYYVTEYPVPDVVLDPSNIECATVPHAPVISVTPEAFTEMLEPGDTLMQTLTIDNLGLGNLNWYINEMLWDNTDIAIQPSGIISNDLTGILPDGRIISADDFTIPTNETWTITYVYTEGFSVDAPDLPTAFGVEFYTDENGKPGTMISTEDVVPADINFSTQKLTLANPVVLAEGHYWISVYAIYEGSTGLTTTRWNWYYGSTAIGDDAALQDFADYFSDLGEGWFYLSEIGIADAPSLYFQIKGTKTTETTWLTVDPSSGIILPSGQQVLDVYFDATLLEPGIYTTSININSNDPLMPLVAVPVELIVSITQEINLNMGWGAWSSYVDPMTDAMFADVIAPVEGDMIISQHFADLFYPEFDINTMGDFSNAHGYVSKMSEATTLPLTGIMANATIALDMGWNLLPVISYCDVDVTLLGLVPGFVAALDIAGGGIYYPEYDLNSIISMVPGAAYYVKMDAAGSFTFPECTLFDGASANKPYRVENTTNWNTVNYTGVSHAVIFTEMATENMLAGDIIGAFTADGLCAGIAEVITGSAGLKVFASDITTLETDGFVEGETLSYKVYRPATGEEFILGVTYDISAPNADGLFASNGLSVVSDLTMSVTGINTQMLNGLSVYPNPSTGIFNISISKLDQDINYVIVNAKGQEIFEAKLLETQEIDLSSAPKGIYFIKFISNEVLRIEKVVIK